MTDLTRPEPQKIDPARPGSKNFDPDPSLLATKKACKYCPGESQHSMISPTEKSPTLPNRLLRYQLQRNCLPIVKLLNCVPTKLLTNKTAHLLG